MAFPLIDFAKSLNVGGCRVLNTPDLIFLCGGKIARRTRPCLSARDYFLRHLREKEPALARRVQLAEKVNAWFRKKNERYSDLMELEEDLAHLADIIILFVESPGSIAELGAFAASGALKHKTLAVINNSLASPNSFIADGPVRRFKTHNEKYVHYFKWDPNRLDDADTEHEFADIATELSDLLKARDDEQTGEVRFDPDHDPGHVLRLIADLIRIPGVASRSDVAECLKELGLPYTRTDLDRQLFVLTSLRFVTTERRSNQIFFVRKSSAYFLKYAYKDNAINDAKRIQDLVREGLDPRRKAVLRHSIRTRSHGDWRA